MNDSIKNMLNGIKRWAQEIFDLKEDIYSNNLTWKKVFDLTVEETITNDIEFTIPEGTHEFIAVIEGSDVQFENAEKFYLKSNYDSDPSYIYFYIGSVDNADNFRAIQKCIIIDETDVLVEYSAMNIYNLETSESSNRIGTSCPYKKISNTFAFHNTTNKFPAGIKLYVLAR